mmetsp:Transcript_23521/g.56087  ORF Transcript_23521/g.56087 Transcript_23521/m.56087 type:complete len:85 (+) Transcript_23521:1029-1283(+)
MYTRNPSGYTPRAFSIFVSVCSATSWVGASLIYLSELVLADSNAPTMARDSGEEERQGQPVSDHDARLRTPQWPQKFVDGDEEV